MLVQYGIYTVSIKKLMQMVNGIQLIGPDESYGYTLQRMCGLVAPPIAKDETWII